MGSHNQFAEQYAAKGAGQNIVNDPGDAGTINIFLDDARCNLTCASGSETRTLGDPTADGQRASLYMLTNDGTDITITASSPYDEAGNTTMLFNAEGEFVDLEGVVDAIETATTAATYAWRVTGFDGVTGPSLATGNILATEAGAGITGGTGTIYESSVVKSGGIYKTSILIDLTGLSSSTTDLDIIGQSTPVAHLGQITAARNGTILSGRMTCLEAPVGGVTDIDVYSATEATGVFDGGIAALTETALITSNAAWTIARVLAFTGIPAADSYLYLTGGAAGTAAAYTAGKFLIELEGYDA